MTLPNIYEQSNQDLDHVIRQPQHRANPRFFNSNISKFEAPKLITVQKTYVNEHVEPETNQVNGLIYKIKKPKKDESPKVI